METVQQQSNNYILFKKSDPYMSESSQCRCLNCLERFPIKPNAKEATCPRCKIKYRISWPWPGQPKIRGLAK